ncbi:MAG: 3-isopropylmalate dehydrogenase [Sorangiineae bacterium NIC37A_2]|jgi:3-isopropylmalate dehydrogenase|nr:MAG: 3-isopropylmalate dehydrogenase [Sorangiineae bacterium NIC37A_2]
MEAKIVVLGGDGIGPEITNVAVSLLRAVAHKFGHTFHFDEQLIGGIAIDKTGSALPDATLAACKDASAVLLGAVGGPKWDDPAAKVRPEQGLLAIRKGLGLYANLRPVRGSSKLLGASPLKREVVEGVDLLVVRELTGGLYFGKREEATGSGPDASAYDTMIYTGQEIRRVLELGVKLAAGRRKKVTSVDKANVLASSRLWRKIATEIIAENPGIEFEHQLVDSCAMRLVTNPKSFDVIVTENMFGDILSDEAAVLTGSLGMLPSASLGTGTMGLYEPIHGSAPDIAGQGIANPLGTVLSAAMLLRHSLNLEAEAAAIEAAADKVLEEGHLTRDLGGTATTQEMEVALLRAL